MENAACSNWRSRNYLTNLHTALCSNQGTLLSQSLSSMGTNPTFSYSRTHMLESRADLQTGSSGKLKPPSTLQDQVLWYLCKHKVRFNKQLWQSNSSLPLKGEDSTLPCLLTSLHHQPSPSLPHSGSGTHLLSNTQTDRGVSTLLLCWDFLPD